MATPPLGLVNGEAPVRIQGNGGRDTVLNGIPGKMKKYINAETGEIVWRFVPINNNEVASAKTLASKTVKVVTVALIMLTLAIIVTGFVLMLLNPYTAVLFVIGKALFMSGLLVPSPVLFMLILANYRGMRWILG